MKKSFERLNDFYSSCADNYHNDGLSKNAARLGLIVGALLTLGACLNIDNLITNLNNKSTLPLAAITLNFGIPILINFIREKNGYYDNK
ncbi:MAG: hypothetical protein N2482_02585 [Patescibacteria group bacterium]|nr:hypothetical protein [Patescibacteria group bacterium]